MIVVLNIKDIKIPVQKNIRVNKNFQIIYYIVTDVKLYLKAFRDDFFFKIKDLGVCSVHKLLKKVLNSEVFGINYGD